MVAADPNFHVPRGLGSRDEVATCARLVTRIVD